jgi:uncharacterized protein DUF4189
MRNLLALTALMIVVAPSATHQAIAAGAVAVGVANGGVAQGYASAYSVNSADFDAAKAKALAYCKGGQNTNASGAPANAGTRAAQAKCEVVATFADKCYAAAVDPKDGTPGVGWAVADTQQEADNQALAGCRDTAGADRRDFCKIFNRACDGGGR